MKYWKILCAAALACELVALPGLAAAADPVVLKFSHEAPETQARAAPPTTSPRRSRS